jgi:hypothetical protein
MRGGSACDRMSYIIQTQCQCNIVLNMHAQTEDKSGDAKNNFYEELVHVFDQFLR